MKATIHSFWLPKLGSSASEYEDAFALSGTGTIRSSEMRFAVADGASESYLAGRWANVLCENFAKHGALDHRTLVTSAILEWQQIVLEYVAQREESGNPIQWYEEPGIARGAFATLCGIEFRGAMFGDGKWEATSLGDSCIMQVRKDTVITAFPIESSEAFGYTPELFPTKPPSIDKVLEYMKSDSGTFKTGDTFFLMTDAMANWFLRQVERGRKPWDELKALNPKKMELFGDWINNLRENKKIHNDDVTLVIVEIN